MNDKTETRPHIGMPAALPPDETIEEAAIAATSEVLVQRAPGGNGMAVVIEPTPLSMLAGALQAGHDIDKLDKLMELAERYEANQARKEFAGAMAKFQATCPPIVAASTAFVNTKDGGTYSYTYADLDNIMATIRPTLRKCGLSVRFDTVVADDGQGITSLCHVMHKDGHTETTTFKCPVDAGLKMNDSQKMGSANSYACRYNVCNALALTAGEDDDGAAGDTRRGAPTPPKPTDIDEFFPVGKHKGKPWDQVPLDYLEWAASNLTDKPEIVAKCKQQMEARGDADQPAPSEKGEPTLAECARWISQAKDPEELAEAWSMVPDKHQPGVEAFHNTKSAELAAAK